MEILIKKSENPPIFCDDCKKKVRIYLDIMHLVILGADFQAGVYPHLFNSYICLDCFCDQLKTLKKK